MREKNDKNQQRKRELEKGSHEYVKWLTVKAVLSNEENGDIFMAINGFSSEILLF
jgi:hypothetical protein